jgi:hypothetical protein
MKKGTRLVTSSKPWHVTEGLYGRFVRELSGRTQLAVIVDEALAAEKLRGA